MSEGIVIALLGLLGGVLGAAANAYLARATVQAAQMQTNDYETNMTVSAKMKPKSPFLSALIGGFIGGILGLAVGIFLIGNVFQRNTLANQFQASPISPSATNTAISVSTIITPTLIPVSYLSTLPTLTATLALSETYSEAVTGLLSAGKLVSATFELDYMSLQGDRLLVYTKLSADGCIRFLSRNPELSKTNYGSPNLIETGGFFKKSEVCDRKKDKGWLIYQVDPATFSLTGLYTFDLNGLLGGPYASYGGAFPLQSFEVR